jgi:pimeloyl-ACP methyl ester carboxylesterase
VSVAEIEVTLTDGRVLHGYHTGEPGQVALVWHHGTPNVGRPPAPLFEVAARLGMRWVSYDRPGYGGSSPHPGRNVASAAEDVSAVVDALGIERFAVVGHSGGSPHALACAALLPDRVFGVVGMACLAPYRASGLDWFAGMIASGESSLRAAAAGPAAKQAYEASGAEYDPEFTPADLATLHGDWAWLGSVVEPAMAAGPAALIDDDLAYVAPWGFDPAAILAPALFLHGRQDGIVPAAHSEWLARTCPRAELRLTPGDGHVSILEQAPAALEWLYAQIDSAGSFEDGR